MALVKLLLLIVVVIAQTYGVCTPPNVRPPTEQLREQGGIERAIPRFIILGRAILYSWALLEASVLFVLSGHCPSALAQPLLRLLPPVPSFAIPSPAFLAGTLLALAGALLRIHCYRVLGQLFTFELAIRPTHTLVTHGVYAIVRHPSYSGVLAVAVSWLLFLFDPRGVVVCVITGAVWGHESANGNGSGSGSGRAPMALLACVLATHFGMALFGMSKRMDREDAMLEKNFGEEWRAWARRVPYRLVPGVY